MNDKETYFQYLDSLRIAGTCNMFGAVPFIMSAFPELSKLEAKDILFEWMDTFTTRNANS